MLPTLTQTTFGFPPLPLPLRKKYVDEVDEEEKEGNANNKAVRHSRRTVGHLFLIRISLTNLYVTELADD